jgi:hypothetical protein
VFCGAGAHGAYHAGALRALQEAGVKIDLLAGHGVGAATAVLGAIDGASRLWEPAGVWRRPITARLYGWSAALRAAGWLFLLLCAVLLIPLLLVSLGIIVYPLGFVLGVVGTNAGAALTSAYADWLQRAFAAGNLPTIIPRLATITLAALLIVFAWDILRGRWRAPSRRRAEGGWWWRPIGSPLEASIARDLVIGTIWELIRGAAPAGRPAPAAIGRRYADVLAESLGQPGFREIVIVATDLDARREVVAALLQEPFRQQFLAPRSDTDRRSEVLDLTGAAREHVVDVLAGALTPLFACEPHLVTFAPDEYWRGESHRLCDRPSSVIRVFEEVAAAGATQAIVVSPISFTAAPHRLRPPRLEPRSRLGEFLVADASVALRDALEAARFRFDSVHVIAPAHNPVGPFDFNGAYDDASDRRQDLVELMEHAYEDAYRQFIEPVVGASGEDLARSGGAGDQEPAAHDSGLTLLFDDMRQPE